MVKAGTHLFAPAVLGMEGAKSEAIKCRRAMEAHAAARAQIGGQGGSGSASSAPQRQVQDFVNFGPI